MPPASVSYSTAVVRWTRRRLPRARQGPTLCRGSGGAPRRRGRSFGRRRSSWRLPRGRRREVVVAPVGRTEAEVVVVAAALGGPRACSLCWPFPPPVVVAKEGCTAAVGGELRGRGAPGGARGRGRGGGLKNLLVDPPRPQKPPRRTAAPRATGGGLHRPCSPNNCSYVDNLLTQDSDHSVVAGTFTIRRRTTPRRAKTTTICNFCRAAANVPPFDPCERS